MGKKSGPGGGKKGGGKGKSLSKAKKGNIKRNKLVKAGKMKPSGSKPRFVEGGHLQIRAQERKEKRKNQRTLSSIDAEQNRLEQEERMEKKKREVSRFQYYYIITFYRR